MKPIEQWQQKVREQYVGINHVKWNEIYDTEEELIGDMLCVDCTKRNPVRGYEFIAGFQIWHGAGRELTAKQITQTKRLAGNIAYDLYLRDWG